MSAEFSKFDCGLMYMDGAPLTSIYANCKIHVMTIYRRKKMGKQLGNNFLHPQYHFLHLLSSNAGKKGQISDWPPKLQFILPSLLCYIWVIGLLSASRCSLQDLLNIYEGLVLIQAGIDQLICLSVRISCLAISGPIETCKSVSRPFLTLCLCIFASISCLPPYIIGH